MKTLLSISFCLVLFFVGCQEQVNNTKSIDYGSLEIQELANEISKDSVYLDLQEQTNDHLDKIMTMLKRKEKSDLKKLSKEEVLNQLGLNEEYWEKRKTIVLDKANYLNEKFELNERPDEEVKQLFKVLLYNSSQNTLNKSNNCQAQFEADIASAHATYDFMIMVGCPVMALRTGPGGYVACSAGAVYNATLAVANAIDDYNSCMS